MMDELRINGKPFVMNSTLSGMQAMITANRLLSKGTPAHFVIVIGVELISPFTMFLFEQAGLVGDTMDGRLILHATVRTGRIGRLCHFRT